MLELGSIVADRFRIERVLGSGGMGVVAIATNLQLDQRVVIKVLHDRFAGEPDVVARFLREARAAAKLRSEHVCRVFDAITQPSGSPLLVMELLHGRDLAAEIAAGPLPVAEAVDRVLQACAGIAEAHAHGIVHRDLKPANLFVTRGLDGAPLVKVLDFGIAKLTTHTRQLTHDDVVLGTPVYMSPEQLRSARDVDARADQWALGVILYQAVSGRLPFSGPNVAEVAARIARDAPAPLDSARVDPAFAAVVMRSLAKDPAQRYRDIVGFARALVPFGGPTAATTAALAARLLGDNIGNDATLRPGALAAVLAETVAPVEETVATQSPIATDPTVAAPVPPAARSSVPRAGVIAAVVLGIGMVAATTAIVIGHHRKPAVATAPPAPAPAPVPAPATAPPPPAPPARAAEAAKPAASHPAPVHDDYARIATDACTRHDAPAARRALQRIAAAKRKAITDRCRKLGTPL